jgi:tripartite-type tricarboxylate transporter receptor subunit TctC
MERGEVQGRAGSTFNTLMANNPEWVKDKKLNILVQIGQEKEPGFEQIPMLTDFAKDQTTREVLDIFAGQVTLGRPYLLPPNVPADRVAAMRASFDATLKDPALLADAKTARLEISPTKGETLQKLVEAMMKIDDAVLARTKAALETKGAIAEHSKGGSAK